MSGDGGIACPTADVTVDDSSDSSGDATVSVVVALIRTSWLTPSLEDILSTASDSSIVDRIAEPLCPKITVPLVLA